ncbi:MAG: hypothetical protein WBL68_16040 [Nitrososphaeraceae archaeon]
MVCSGDLRGTGDLGKHENIKKVLVLGSGAIKIGEAGESLSINRRPSFRLLWLSMPQSVKRR